MKVVWGLCLGVLLVGSCQKDVTRDIRPFYYPVEQLGEGLVYEYQTVGETNLAPYYKYYISVQNDTGTFLVSNYYDHLYRNTQFSLEEIIPEGAVLKDYHFMDYDSLGNLSKKIIADVKASSLMAFEWTGEEGYLASEIEFKDFNDSLLLNTLSRKRSYLKDTTYSVLGKERDCVVFSVDEVIAYNNQGEYLEYDSKILEFYAEGLGLVYFKKTIQNNLEQAFELSNQYPIDTLINRADLDK